MRMSDIGVTAERITVDGTDYIVTQGTGEVGFGRDGGTASFAYLADDVDALDGVADYSDFCLQISTEEDRDLAIALAAQHEFRLVGDGACNPILTDAEYTLIRATVAAMEAVS